MGDFQGHPFRGNQWTNGRQFVDGRVAAAGTKASATVGYIRQQLVEAQARSGVLPPKEELQAKLKSLEAQMPGALQREKDSESKLKDLDNQMRRDLAREFAAKREAEDACGQAWKDWDAASRDPVTRFAKQMPDEDDKAGIAKLSPEEREAFDEYRRTQKETIRAGDAYRVAEKNWQRTHDAELREAQKEVQTARAVRNDLAREQDLTSRQIRTYERESARAQQTSAEAREPRETAATQYHATDEAGQKTLDYVAGKDEYSRPSLMHLSDGTWVDVAHGETAIKLTPGFKATIRSGGEFKTAMSKLFPGANIVGLPRKADPHILTMVHDEFRALRDEFPEVAVRTIKMNAGGFRATAWSGDDKITFGRKGIEDFTAAHLAFGRGVRRSNPDDRPGFHDGARSYAFLVRHEFGHQVHFQHPDVLAAFNREFNNLPAQVRSRVTGYANKNRHEMFAETFAMMKFGDEGTKKHPAVAIMRSVLDQYFKKRRGGK